MIRGNFYPRQIPRIELTTVSGLDLINALLNDFARKHPVLFSLMIGLHITYLVYRARKPSSEDQNNEEAGQSSENQNNEEAGPSLENENNQEAEPLSENQNNEEVEPSIEDENNQEADLSRNASNEEEKEEEIEIEAAMLSSVKSIESNNLWQDGTEYERDEDGRLEENEELKKKLADLETKLELKEKKEKEHQQLLDEKNQRIRQLLTTKAASLQASRKAKGSRKDSNRDEIRERLLGNKIGSSQLLQSRKTIDSEIVRATKSEGDSPPKSDKSISSNYSTENN